MILQQEETNKLERNIWLLYATAMLTWGRFFVPILALFYIASEVTLEQFGIIMGAFTLTIFLLEVPSGVIADFLGKKRSILVAKFLFLIEVLIIAFSYGFWPFLIAKVISGVAVALLSGPMSALLFDTLKKLGREKEHRKISGTKDSLERVSMMLVFVTGSFLFAISPKLPAYVSIPFIAVDLILMFLLLEPNTNRRKLSLQNSFSHLKDSILYVSKHKELLGILIYAAPLAAAVTIVYNLSSDYLASVAFPIALIGSLAALGSLLAAAMSYWAEEIESWLGKKTFILVQASIFLAVLIQALSYPIIGPLALLFIYLPHGLFAVLVNHYVNHYAKTSQRATVISINSLLSSFLILFFMPTIAFLATKSYLFAYSLLLIPVLVSLVALHYLRKPLKSRQQVSG